jgi:fucose permease
MRKNLGMLALIMAFWFTISFITNILGPLIPDIIHNFNLSDLAMAGFIPTSFFLAYAIMSIPAGLLIDRFGEKPILFGGFRSIFIITKTITYALDCSIRKYWRKGLRKLQITPLNWLLRISV